MIAWILSPIGRWLAGAGGVVLAIITIYGKGRRDARQNIEGKNNADILNRTQKAVAAGDIVSRDPSRLREDDGNRRD